jgi:hypothetical protein
MAPVFPPFFAYSMIKATIRRRQRSSLGVIASLALRRRQRRPAPAFVCATFRPSPPRVSAT